MAKKKDEKDVLVVRDEKTGEISVVAGLNADGTPKRTPAKAENAQSFLQFDRHGDVLDNFFKNFFRQCKEPSRFGFYRIAADQAENLLEVMKQLLKDPEANKELLAPHKVDTSDYEKKVQEEMAAQQTEKQEPQKQENMEQRKEQQQDKSEQMQGKRGYQPIDESKINWQELEDRWGVKRDNLEKSGDLTKMLNYGKSDLVKVKPTFGGESFELDARLSFKKDGEGNISLVPHFIRKEQKLDEYKEHKFSDNDRKNLRETGNLGRVVDIVDRETGEIIPSYISIDRKTNEITDIPASKVRIPERIVPAWVQAEHVEPPDERLAAAQKENPDTVAWITIPGTNIDAPVQQYGDNDYYLRRDEKGVKDYHGCIYADYACRMDSSVKVSRNLIFYGHTFTDEDYTGGFEDLHKYRVFEFGQENPYIYVSLADEKLAYQIFSVWVCDANDDTDCIQADPDDAAFQQILDKAVAGCAFDYGVDVTTDDHILTLSTCTADPNSRLLVVAKLIDGGGADVKS